MCTTDAATGEFDLSAAVTKLTSYLASTEGQAAQARQREAQREILRRFRKPLTWEQLNRPIDF
jgi:hypothetical protein